MTGGRKEGRTDGRTKQRLYALRSGSILSDHDGRTDDEQSGDYMLSLRGA